LPWIAVTLNGPNPSGIDASTKPPGALVGANVFE